MKSILTTYEMASGQSINFTKSSLSFSYNVSTEDQRQICEYFGIALAVSHQKYLGLPASIGRNKTEMLQYIKEQFCSRISTWNRRFLSRARKELLLKTVAQALPAYTMNVFLLPLDLCRELEQLMNNFFWGSTRYVKKIHWKSWSNLSKPKFAGGLGFRRLHDFNVALLGKAGWRFLTQPSALVTQIYQARYFPSCSFLDAQIGHNPSYAWRSILESQHTLRNGCRWRIGSGHNVSVWNSPWLPDNSFPFVMSPSIEYLEDLTVADLKLNGDWDVPMLRTLFLQRDVELITKIPLSNQLEDDVLMWSLEPRGEYTVKSASRILAATVEPAQIDSGCWRNIWSATVPPKVKNFVWRAASDCLPTNYNLTKRRVNVSPSCYFCKQQVETSTHVLFQCPFAVQVWCLSGSQIAPQHCHSVKDWLIGIAATHSREECNLFFTILWALWKARNAAIWRNSFQRPRYVLHQARSFLTEWTKQQQLYEVNQLNTSPCSSSVWKKPNAGELKLNCDAALFESAGKTEAAWILRDSAGVFVAAAAMRWNCLYSPIIAELVSIREALSWLKGRGQFVSSIETDSLLAAQAIMGHQHYRRSEFGVIALECFHLLSSLCNCRLVHVKRSANYVAHLLSRATNSLSDPMSWECQPPDCIVTALADDVVN